MKLGAQLFTLRNQMKTPEQIKSGLERVAKIGYTCVQVSGIGKIDVKELADTCNSLGLEIAVTHTAPDRILGDTDTVIKEHDVMNCKYIGLGSMAKNYRSFEGIDDFFANFKTAIGKIKDAGKVFTYHNHAFEFEKLSGELMLDRLVSKFAPDELMVTLDCYWANYGGVDVCETIDRLAGRIDCVHLKDYGIIGSEIKMLPVGEGNMNYPKILEHFEKAGTKYALVEQDDCNGRDPFECLESSFDYLKKYF